MAAPGPPVAGSPTKPFNTTGVSVPVVAGTAPGDFVVVALSKEIAAAVTTLPSGFAEAGTAAAATGHVLAHHLFVKRVSADDESGTYDFAWSGTAPYAEACALRVPGVIGSGAGYEAATGAARSSAAAATPNVALTTLGAERLVVWSGANYNGGSWTPPSGFDERYDGGTCLTIATAPQLVAGSTGNVAGSCSASEYSTARMLALIPATAGVRRGLPIGVFL